MNKSGHAHLAILGVSVGAIIIFLIRMMAFNEVYDALEPELQKALMDLGEKIVCPPELNNSEFELCISNEGDVIVNGEVSETTSIEFNSEGKTSSCLLHMGEYVDKKTCRIDDFNKLNVFEMHYNYKATTMKLNSKNLEFYIFNSKNLKIPIKQWSGLLRVTRYIPK